MTDEEEQQQQMNTLPFLEPPKDLYELYMMTRAEISSTTSFNQYYMKLMQLIDIGKEMLPSDMSALREEAEKTLVNSKSYPEPRQMERDEGGYRMGTRTTSTGLIHVRNEDLSVALEECKNQQATTLVPALKSIDSKIFRALIEVGIIDIKRPSMEAVMMEDVMSSLQKKVAEENERRRTG